MKLRLWPKSLLGQMLMAIAMALLVAQGVSAFLLMRAQQQGNETLLMNGAAFRLALPNENWRGRGGGIEVLPALPPRFDQPRPRRIRINRDRNEAFIRTEYVDLFEQQSGDSRSEAREEHLRGIFLRQAIPVEELIVVTRKVGDDPVALRSLSRRSSLRDDPDLEDRDLLVSALQTEAGGEWTIARQVIPERDWRALGGIISQTLVIYLALVVGLGLVLRKITRPLAALRDRLDLFARTQSTDGQLEPQGPDDTRRLIEAHNAMEDRIASMLNEKDVMLGAIGHDLKTPLAALRVRIESVEDDIERQRMADGIEDITRTLDDILHLARAGRPSDPLEPTELRALAGSVVEEYEDMGEPVTIDDAERLVVPARTTWLRRALRNLVGNALRYGEAARVSLLTEGDQAILRVEDDGPGIPEDEIARMTEPFTRGDPSRNRGTGGAGLGLALARAIAEQHGGRLVLANRKDANSEIAGLTAEIRLPRN
jgi:signal transduction histidine kinase